MLPELVSNYLKKRQIDNARREKDLNRVNRERHILRASGANIVLVHEFCKCVDLVQPLAGQKIKKPLVQSKAEVFGQNVLPMVMLDKASKGSLDMYPLPHPIFTKQSANMLSDEIAEGKERAAERLEKMRKFAEMEAKMIKALFGAGCKDVEIEVEIETPGIDDIAIALPVAKLSDLVDIWVDVCSVEKLIDRSIRKDQGPNVLTVLNGFNKLSDYRDYFGDIGSGSNKRDKDKEASVSPLGDLGFGVPIPSGNS
jgi:hypothetical protein